MINNDISNIDPSVIKVATLGDSEDWKILFNHLFLVRSEVNLRSNHGSPQGWLDSMTFFWRRMRCFDKSNHVYLKSWAWLKLFSTTVPSRASWFWTKAVLVAHLRNLRSNSRRELLALLGHEVIRLQKRRDEVARCTRNEKNRGTSPKKIQLQNILYIHSSIKVCMCVCVCAFIRLIFIIYSTL